MFQKKKTKKKGNVFQAMGETVVNCLSGILLPIGKVNPCRTELCWRCPALLHAEDTVPCTGAGVISSRTGPLLFPLYLPLAFVGLAFS